MPRLCALHLLFSPPILALVKCSETVYETQLCLEMENKYIQKFVPKNRYLTRQV